MKKRPDLFLLVTITLLIILGVMILASVSAPFSQQKADNPYYFLKHQALFGLIPGIILAILAFKINLAILKKWAPFLLLANLILLLMVFLPKIGTETLGAARWLRLGPISFQPSEFLKLTFILYLASFLAAKTPHQNPRTRTKFGAGLVQNRSEASGSGLRFGTGQASHEQRQFWTGISQTFLAFLVIIGAISLLLILQPDVSTLGIILLTAVLMYFLAKTPLWHNVLVFLIGTGGLIFLIKFAAYRFTRIAVFLNPELDLMGKGYQIKQALIAIGSGGIFGQGLGMSAQKFLGALPQMMSDSIFAIFAEETGLIGTSILIVLFLLFLWANFRIAKKTQDRFSQLAVLGITCWICLQAFINISSITKLLPLAGIPLPFISYGGSALATELAAMGILLNISKNT